MKPLFLSILLVVISAGCLSTTAPDSEGTDGGDETSDASSSIAPDASRQIAPDASTGPRPDAGGADAGSSADAGPHCANVQDTCARSADCCDGLNCIQGKCLACRWTEPQYCAEFGGTCWSDGTVCSTAVRCSDGKLWACRSAQFTYDCSSGTCRCANPNYPVMCDATGPFPGECWSPGVDCTTRVYCNGQTRACRAGYRYDCATSTCQLVPVAVPAWLVGTWSRSGKEENNVYFHSDDRSLTFSSSGSYTHKLGSASPGNGNFNIVGDVLTFTSGPLNGTTLNLKTSFQTSCRILNGFGTPLWRYGEVAGCPTAQRVSAAECAYVGTYTKKSTSGSIGSSGSGTQTDYTETVKLERDTFYTRDSSTFKETCYAYNCNYLSGQIETQVGAWSAATGASPYSMSTLRSWSFTKSTAPCP